MYLGVDVGGTKTLVAVFDKSGNLKASQKFPTPERYEDFLKELAINVANLSTEPFMAACVALPGIIDDSGKVGVALGNLPWLNVPILADCKRMFRCPLAVENDAKLAGLSEAKLIKKDFNKVLYITVSTGIGYSVITDGVIEQSFADGGGRTILLERNGVMVPWESFASGKAIVEKYNRRASELEDPKAWEAISRNLAVGLIDLIAVIQPDVIVFGGGVGTHFKKFEKPLKKILAGYETPLMPIPPIKIAKHPEEAVIYGCYDLIKDLYGTRSRKT